MNRFYLKSIAFWFILLSMALVNAVIRETTYKPLLEPIIGIWAHQISSLTAILLFALAIYAFLKNVHQNYRSRDLYFVGLIWMIMTIVFETGMNVFIRHLNLTEVLQTYYFWRGDTWFFVLLSLVILPAVIAKKIQEKRQIDFQNGEELFKIFGK